MSEYRRGFKGLPVGNPTFPAPRRKPGDGKEKRPAGINRQGVILEHVLFALPA
jgi:hypothetical protein